MSRVRAISQVLNFVSRRAIISRPVSLVSNSLILSNRTFANRGAIIPRRSYVVSTEGTNIESLVDNISPSQYNLIANEYLETLSDDIEDLCEDFPQIDVELSQGVMTLTVARGKTYVINKQPPNKQIWLSSPYSGPKRYDLIGGKWITLRDNTSLTDLLQNELKVELGQDVSLSVEH